jgi:hypothetical protein
MKFCAKCGTPLADEAMFCTNCGTAAPASAPQQTYAAPQPTYAAPQQTYAAPQPTYAAPQQAEQIKADVPKLHCVFNLIYAISSVLTVLFSILSIGWGYFNLYSYSAFLYPDESLTALALFFSFVSLAFGIVSFASAIKNHPANTLKFAAISRFVIGIILPIFVLILMSVGW